MADFGDELIVESFKVPWLIWIQLLVTILLVILLFFGFTVFSSDPSTSSSAASQSTAGVAAPTTHCSNPTSSNKVSKVEDRRVRWDAGTSGGSIQQDDHGEEESSMLTRIFQHPCHPCNYIGLAKRALFKCFGLDSTSESSNNRQHEKQE